MIHLDQYFRDMKPCNEHQANAEALLLAVNRLMDEAFVAGIDFKVSPVTMNHISTSDGGYRAADCGTGAPRSAHKSGMAVDIYDGSLDFKQPFATWCMTHQDRLAEHGLYMEHPTCTRGRYTSWCHLTTRPPTSGNRVFKP